ncbi:MAG: ribonuclease E/G, partial [Nitrospinae bacterium]|nr:ribonuclease E/G [Nitrospinota bacterium]
VARTVRDFFTPDTHRVMVDQAKEYRRLLDFVGHFMPRLKPKITHYTRPEPIMEHFGIEDKIRKALERKIWLKSGGHIIIERTEALIAVDVNTGRYVGKRNQEETILKTNLEAAIEIVTQLRLRNIGGIIIIDFIDMRDRKHKAAVEREFRAAVKPDKARIQTSSISRFGLMELSRQRLRSPLMDVSFSSCPNCQGHGVIKSTEAKSMEILRKIHTAAARGNVREVRGIMSASVVEYLLNRKRRELLQIEIDYDVKVVLSGTTEILGTHYELEYVRRDVPKEERPPRARRRRRRAPKSEEPEAVSKPQEEPVSEEGQEGLLHAGLRFISRLRPTPLRWLRAEEEEPSRTDSPLPSHQDALEEVAEVIDRSQASGGGEDAPAPTEQTSSGRRRSRSRSSRRRRSSRSRTTSPSKSSSPKEEA